MNIYFEIDYDEDDFDRIFNFDYVPYNEQTKAMKAGIGLVPYHEEETVHRVVIPLVKG